MFASAEETDVLLQVMVDFLDAVGLVDDGEEPPRPGEGLGVVAFEELVVEVVDESFHGVLSINAVFAAPAHQRPGFAPDFPFHFLSGRFGNVNAATVTHEAQKLVGFVGREDFFLVVVDLQMVLFQKLK